MTYLTMDKSLLERLAVAAQNVDQLVLDQFLDGGAGGLQVLAGIELVGMLTEELTDRAGHGQTQVGVDVDLADGAAGGLTELLLGNAHRVGHLAAVGIPEEQLRKAAESAVCKINIDSDLRLAMTGTIRQFYTEHPDKFDPREYLKPARANIKVLVRHKLVDVLGCNGMA